MRRCGIALLLIIVLFPGAKSCAQNTGPWDLRQLASPPDFIWHNQTGQVRSLVYSGEVYSGEAYPGEAKGEVTQVFAHYATPGILAGDPNQDAELPAVVLVHGGNGKAFPQWVEQWANRGYAAIAMDLQGPSEADLVEITEPIEQNWFYQAVSHIILAHSLLLSFEEVDADRTAIVGISFGGTLTCIVAGLDDRFKVAVSAYGCGFLHENSVLTKGLAMLSPDDRERWINLYEPSNYLPQINIPTMFLTGMNDAFFPLDTYAKSYNSIQGPVNLRIVPDMEHGYEAVWNIAEIGLFVDQYLTEGDPLPLVGYPDIEGDRIQAEVMSQYPIVSAQLHFTLETGELTPQEAYNRRVWQPPIEATLEGSIIRAQAPPIEARIWFFTVTDEQNRRVSSPLVFNRND